MEALHELLRKGANPNTVNEGGTSLLQRSLLFGDKSPYANAKALLDHGANPNYADRDGRTALHLAAEDSIGAVMTTLLAAGGDPLLEIPGEEDSSPYAVALSSGNVGAMTAIELTTEYRHPNRDEMLKWGVFGKVIADGMETALTVGERQEIIRTALATVFTDAGELQEAVDEVIGSLREVYGEEMFGAERTGEEK